MTTIVNNKSVNLILIYVYAHIYYTYTSIYTFYNIYLPIKAKQFQSHNCYLMQFHRNVNQNILYLK